MSNSSVDVKKLMTAGDIGTADRIWQIDFSFKIPVDAVPPEERACPDCGEEHDLDELRTIHDKLTVLGGPDAQQAVDRVRDHVTGDSELSDFSLTGVQLLAAAEIV